jgi:hypothetical protein
MMTSWKSVHRTAIGLAGAFLLTLGFDTVDAADASQRICGEHQSLMAPSP